MRKYEDRTLWVSSAPPTRGRRESKCARALVEAFVFEGFFGLLVFVPVFGASGFAAAKADPVFGRTTLVFGALALFLYLLRLTIIAFADPLLRVLHTP
jgi:hypothetical protein